MNRSNAIAWCAGLFEGEGTIVYGDSHKGSLQIRISSTDKDVLDLMTERSGEGKVSGPYDPKGFGKKPYFMWIANGARAVALIHEMLPYLGQRRTERLLEKIALWQSRPLRAIADRDAMRADRKTGMTYKAIGEKHRVSLSRAHQVCHDVLVS